MSTPPKSRFALSAKQVAGLVLIVLSVVFAAENTRRIKVRFFVPDVTAPLWLSLLVPLVLGFAAGALVVHRRR
jgi:uncharacterized integral membrane protein